MRHEKPFDTVEFSSTARMPVYAIALLYLTASNLPLLLSTRAFGATPHGVFNVEYLLIGAVSVFVPRSTVFLLLCAESLADFAYSICYTFQFSLEDMLSSLRYLTLLPRVRVLEGFVLLPAVILVCGTLSLARPRPQMRLRTAAVMLLLVAAFVPVDILSGQNPVWRKGDVALLSFRVARSPLLALGVREVKTERVYAGSRSSGEAPMPAASDGAVSLLDARPGTALFPNIVLIVVESWGALLDPHLAHALTAPYDDPRVLSRYSASYGTVPFTGLTVPGEARELCHSTIGFGIVHLSAEQSERCLPALFHAHGYKNVAIHGYVGQMFSRSSWYREIGFDEMWFQPDLKRAGLPACVGAFPGICDASIADWIGTSLLSRDRDQPMFLYWVTLNSHVPEPAHPDLPDDGVCNTQPALRDSTALCSWFRLVRTVHQSIEKVALQAPSRPTVFVLVGDHAPPFGDTALAEQFSSTQVPYVLLTPVDLTLR
jgi:hypothetical protein